MKESVMRHTAWGLLPLALLAAPLMGQYDWRAMTTNLTGTDLIFSTTWTLKGEPYNPYSKLIHYRAGQLRTLRSVLPERDPVAGCVTNHPNLTQPEMSMDGTRYSYTASWTGHDLCMMSTIGEVRRDTGELIHSEKGSIRMSANGRWALFRTGNSYGLTDLETGFQETFVYVDPFNTALFSRAVANDGTVALAKWNPWLFLKRPGLASEAHETPFGTESAAIADSGNFAVLMARSAPPSTKGQIWIADFSSRQMIQAVASDEDHCRWPVLSTDGSRMAFLSTANWLTTNNSRTMQAYMMDLNTGELTQLTKGTNTVVLVAISGDGRTAYTRHEDGSILFVDIEAGQSLEIVPAAPNSIGLTSIVPGSRGVISVQGNRQPTLTLDGVELRIVKVAPWQVEFIAPDSLAIGQHELELSYEGSPFQPFKLQATARDYSPSFQFWNTIPQVWHDEGGTAVYEASPARSGEVIEALLAGLGAVDAEGKTRMAMNWQVYHSGQNQGSSIEVLSSRMSPYEGEEGLYRVKFRLPQISLAGNAALRCTDARDESVTASAVFAVAP
ncbi:MAG: hypothetical protein IH602_19485 [Bryobacteraceae bacterium]|nr:hypothetical protein [Bryobacteraceae bacterium]